MTLTSAPGPSGDITSDAYDVVVVGGGPVGIATAIELGIRGRSVLVVEREDGVVRYPTAESIDTASMELLHRWGIAEAVLRSGFPADAPPRRSAGRGAFRRCGIPNAPGRGGKAPSSDCEGCATGSRTLQRCSTT